MVIGPRSIERKKKVSSFSPSIFMTPFDYLFSCFYFVGPFLSKKKKSSFFVILLTESLDPFFFLTPYVSSDMDVYSFKSFSSYRISVRTLFFSYKSPRCDEDTWVVVTIRIGCCDRKWESGYIWPSYFAIVCDILGLFSATPLNFFFYLNTITSRRL